MELIFEDNKDFKKVVQLSNIFGPPDGLTNVMRDYPMLFSSTFLELFSINKDVTGLQHRNKTLYEYLLGVSISPAEAEKCKSIIERLRSVDMHNGDFSDIEKEFRVKISRLYKENAENISKEIEQLFGFSLPRLLVVVVGRNFRPHSISGSGLYYSKASDMCLISLQLENGEFLENVDIYLKVLLHELLHQLIEKYKIIDTDEDRDHFEEALLDYFVPDGILAEKLDLIEKLDIVRLHRNNIRLRIYSEYASTRLLPHIEEYYKSAPKETIWQFLKARGFTNITITPLSFA